MIRMLKQSQVLTYLTHNGPVHFSVLRLKRKIIIQFISKLISFHFRENGLLYLAGEGGGV